MALAVNADSFTLPHNIQEFRMNMGFLPALWAESGDCVLVDDVAFAVKALTLTGIPHADILFLSDAEIKGFPFDSVDAWGWNRALRRRLLADGVDESILPNNQQLDFIRGLANRMLTTDVLMSVRDGLGRVACGKSFYVTDYETVSRLLSHYGRIVLKSPWSSSGRGVRYVDGRDDINVRLWADKVIRRQGGLMVEPHYVCVEDFAMEFSSDGNGGIDYCGLSVFKTERGNYAGNIIATEDAKRQMLGRYVPENLLEEVQQRLIKFFSAAFKRRYRGLFGVDMMIVTDDAGGSFRLHPCVEVNVRRTMGHVANSFKVSPLDPIRLMRITHGVNYTLRLVTPDPGFVKVL